MRCIVKVLSSINSTYKNDIIYFILLFITFFISDVYHHFMNEFYLKCFYNIINAYVLSTFICLILSRVNIISLRNILKLIIILFAFLYVIINYYSISLTLEPLNNGIISIIFSTNINETIEFIRAYIPGYQILLVILLIIFVIYLLKLKVSLNNIACVKILTCLFLLFSALTIINPHSCKDMILGRIYRIFKYNKSVLFIPDLSQYKSNPSFVPTTEYHPENIIMIIGESFAKTHSSLYGYHKETNPLLQVHQNDSNLYVFQNVTSPASHTIAAFKSIMNTYSYERDTGEWYESVTIPECFNSLGYKTIWVSNQYQYGACETISTRFAQLCDTAIFTQNNIYEKCYDEKIIPLIKEQPQEKELFILHLWGQHSYYSERYPEHFNIFKEDDYMDLLQHQRKNVSEYDNATLYNDYVIDSIINFFSDKEAIILYFSDHGQDIYLTDKNYCGHGIPGNERSVNIAKDIPLMIYTSQKFKNKFPLLIDKIKSSTMKNFNTEDVIYSLIDVSGYKFSDNDDVEKFSILSSLR